MATSLIPCVYGEADQVRLAVSTGEQTRRPAVPLTPTLSH